MPKVIKDLKEDILEKSRMLIEENGIEKYSMRAIAKECGIAVGTLYNYFPSKENLIATIMLEDWDEDIKSIYTKADRSFNCSHTLKIVFNSLCEFQSNYKSKIMDVSNYAVIQNELVNMQKQQLSKLIHSTLLYFGVNMSPDPTNFITEVLLFESTKDEITYDEIGPFLEQIVKL